MRKALQLAQKAAQLQEVPIGALIVSPEGKILGTGYNKTELLKCQTEHAELRAVRAACKKQGDWRLDGATLYVTLEPCMMCMSLISLSRIATVVYGAESPLFGYSLDKQSLNGIYTKHVKQVIAGVGADESAALLQHFFKEQRKSL